MLCGRCSAHARPAQAARPSQKAPWPSRPQPLACLDGVKGQRSTLESPAEVDDEEPGVEGREGKSDHSYQTARPHLALRKGGGREPSSARVQEGTFNAARFARHRQAALATGQHWALSAVPSGRPYITERERERGERERERERVERERERESACLRHQVALHGLKHARARQGRQREVQVVRRACSQVMAG